MRVEFYTGDAGVELDDLLHVLDPLGLDAHLQSTVEGEEGVVEIGRVAHTASCAGAKVHSIRSTTWRSRKWAEEEPAANSLLRLPHRVCGTLMLSSRRDSA
jgi:hypothetical protein